MYYNSNKNNNDYYNSYKKEISDLEAYRKEENREKIIKLILSLFTLTLFIVIIFYLYNYFNPLLHGERPSIKNEKEFSKNKILPSIIIREAELPISIQTHEFNMQTIKSNTSDAILQHVKIQNTATQKKQEVIASMNEKNIALIVQIIMSQMNAKIEKPLEEQLREINNKVFVNKSLKESNYYNKVVLTQNEVQEVKNASLVKLSRNLNNIINEEINSNSSYTQAITKEVVFRQNEMRVIVVQKGDTLFRIAKKAYGRNSDYKKIFTANPEIIKNPNQIFVGQRLRIPS